MGSLALKRHNSSQSQNNRKVTDSFAPRPLIFSFQQEVLKFDDICANWSSLKSNLGTSFFNLENQSFENVNFSQ